MKNLKDILIKEKIYLFYNIENRSYFMLNIKLKKKTEFENLFHLYENLVFQLELIYDNLVFKKDDLVKLITKVNGTTYKPTKDLIYINSTQKLVNLNYPKQFIEKLNYNIDEIEPLKDKFPTILTILDNLCENKKKSLNWALDWFSYVVRYNLGLENKKISTSILFYGGQGSGKNLFINGIMDVFIKTKELSQNDLENGFNYYLMESNLITFNEIEVKKNKGTMDIIKNMITCNYHSINLKGVPQFEIPNIHNYLFTSNKKIPLPIESDDRRFTIFKPIKTIASLLSFQDINKLDECLKNPNKKNKFYSELINFGNYLVNNKNISSNLNKPLQNQTKKILTTKSVSINDKFIQELKNKDFFEFCIEHELNYKKYIIGINNNQYYTQKKLIFKLYTDYFEIISKKTEFVKRKDLILDELIEENVFIPLYNKRLSIKLIDSGEFQSRAYLYLFGRINGLYTDEKDISEDLTEIKL